MSDTLRARRYYLRERVLEDRFGESILASVWRWKQESQPGTLLPDDFPFIENLRKVGYTTIEDLDGADSRELQNRARLSVRDAELVERRIGELVRALGLVRVGQALEPL